MASGFARTDSQDEFLLRGLVAATEAAAGRMRVGGLDIDDAQAAINRQDFPNGDPVVGDQVMVSQMPAPPADFSRPAP